MVCYFFIRLLLHSCRCYWNKWYIEHLLFITFILCSQRIHVRVLNKCWTSRHQLTNHKLFALHKQRLSPSTDFILTEVRKGITLFRPAENTQQHCASTALWILSSQQEINLAYQGWIALVILSKISLFALDLE